MSDQKVINDWILATQDAVYLLQEWLGRLEQWQAAGQAEADDFAAACQELREAGLWAWAAQAGGHGLAGLARALNQGGTPDGRTVSPCRYGGAPTSGLMAYGPEEEEEPA
jgi:hypothetical protein